MVLVYVLTLGVYWWDLCYHIYHTWILWVCHYQRLSTTAWAMPEAMATMAAQLTEARETAAMYGVEMPAPHEAERRPSVDSPWALAAASGDLESDVFFGSENLGKIFRKNHPRYLWDFGIFLEKVSPIFFGFFFGWSSLFQINLDEFKVYTQQQKQHNIFIGYTPNGDFSTWWVYPIWCIPNNKKNKTFSDSPFIRFQCAGRCFKSKFWVSWWSERPNFWRRFLVQAPSWWPWIART